MDTRDWEIIKILHEQKNITKTANLLYISQPALTKRLQQIENEFNTQIVIRGRRGVHFTPQGEFLVKCADEMLYRLRSIKDTISDIDDKVVGTLRIGVSNLITRIKIPQILKQFKNNFPEVEFMVSSGWSSEAFHLLTNREIHIAIVRGDYPWQEGKHLLFKEPLTIVSPYPIMLEDLPNLPRIDYGSDSKLRELISHWWSENFSTPPKIAMTVDRTDTCKQMVVNGLGYAILPGLVVNNEKDVYKMNLTTNDGELITRDTWMLYHDESLEYSLVDEFVKFVQELDFENI
ncbi:LysR family transcriptional regulator [Bacillus sp. JJ1521]|uniref:LysR family transcriptional regulator n=1 Tax=Bacillus sp. JJ1521 TaxID=3122957 RepID=UPI002FFFF14F